MKQIEDIDNFSLKNINNFNTILKSNINEIITKYSEIIIHYINFITENIQYKNNNLVMFTVFRGLDTITHVFLLLLHYTKNIDLTYFHCQKSFYYYIEFIEQISEDDKVFLQLSSRDATLYVYKKTIFEINTNIINNLDISYNEIINDKLFILNLYVDLYKTFLYKIIQSNNLKNEKYINITKNIYNKLNSYKIESNIINSLIQLVNKLYYKVHNVDYFFEISNSLIITIIKTPNIINKCEKKISSTDFYDKLATLSKTDFIKWFI